MAEHGREDANLEATWRELGWNLAVLRPSWGHLGAILGPLGAVLGPPWGLLGRSWGVLGASRGHLEVTLHCLRRLSSKSAKMQPLPHEMLIFVAKMGPRWGQDGAKLGQVGPKLAQVEPKLGSSWHLEAMLPSSCRHLGVLARLGGNLAELTPSWSRLGPILTAKRP